MDEETSQSQTPPIRPPFAFEALRRRGRARSACGGRSSPPSDGLSKLPDYSETLAKIVRESAATSNSLKTLATMPALSLTARDWAREIAATGKEASLGGTMPAPAGAAISFRGRSTLRR